MNDSHLLVVELEVAEELQQPGRLNMPTIQTNALHVRFLTAAPADGQSRCEFPVSNVPDTLPTHESPRYYRKQTGKIAFSLNLDIMR